jgi:ABC-type Fe3+ transport system permease subunit
MKSSRAARLAAGLWLVLAVVVWNVVFDRIIVLAGRRYAHAAVTAVNQTGTYVRIDDWMRPAIAHGLWTASAAGIAVAVFGLVAVAVAARRERRRLQRQA